MAVINTNVKALFSQMALGSSGRAQTVAMQQLSTGKRINSARDDAAGMAIATRMTHQIRSLNQAVRNAGDAINLIQTAEGATNEITDMMQRMRELAIQAVNDTNDNAQRSYLDLEFQQLKQQIVQIADQTQWNGFPVLTGEAGQRVGEMPVFKTTSINQFAQVFVDPTTERNVTGKNSGQSQTLDFTAIATDLGSGTLTASPSYTMSLNGVDLSVGFDAGQSYTADEVTAKFAEALQNSSKVEQMTSDISLTSTGELSVTFNKQQGDVAVNKISVKLGAVDKGLIVDVTQNAISTSTELWEPSDGKFLQSGALNFTISQKQSGPELVANFVNNKNQTIPLDVTLNDDGTVSFDPSKGRNSEVLSAKLTYTLKDSKGFDVNISTAAVSMGVSVQGGIPALKDGDMVINGVPIGASYAIDDTASPPDNAAGSAIAKAAAINRKAADSGITTGEVQTLTLTSVPTTLPTPITVGGVNVTLSSADKTPVLAAATIAAALKASPLYDQSTGRSISYQPGSAVVMVNYAAKEGDVAELSFDPRQSGLTGQVRVTTESYTNMPGTGVYAKVNENIVTGQAQTGTSVVKGVVFINGYASADISTVFNNPRDTRANVVRAINMIADKTGVKAIDTGSDDQGVTLVAADGRNVEVRFESKDLDFGARIGMREGVQASTISLESKIQSPVVITSRGSVDNSGFIKGDFTKNESVFNTAPRPPVAASLAQTELIKIAKVAADGDFSITIAGTPFTVPSSTGDEQAIRDGLISAIREKASQLGVTVSAGDSLDSLVVKAQVPGIPFKISAVAPDTSSATLTQLTPNTPAPVKPLTPNDLVINGVKIRATVPADDTLSSTVPTSSDAMASAIAVANAINSQSADTGVRAYPNPVTLDGMTMTQDALSTPQKAGQYALYVNGTKVSVYLDPNDKAETRLTNVMRAINGRTGQHGVTATVNDQGGLSLASDGRNLSVWFDSNKDGLSAASFGLDKGGAKAQVSTMSFTPATAGASDVISFEINGVSIEVTGTGTDSTAQLVADEILAQGIKNIEFDTSSTPGVLTLTSKIPGTGFTLVGASVSGTSATTTQFDIATTTPNDMGKNDVTGIYDADETSTTAKTLYGTVRLVSDPALLPMGVPAPEGAPPSDQLLKLKATGKPFTVSTGIDGLGSKSNFSALGFQVGSYGGQSSSAMDPPRVGRMSFQVGAGANQTITIDLADFGKNGAITSEITGDVDLNVESRTARINTGEGATAVLAKLDLVMDRVNATRATMGAVMNRLDHVINNLTNVSMNLSASRSAIEDADYAAASTELAKTQIMQQAATAVLAQANTSQQSVLKLLGG